MNPPQPEIWPTPAFYKTCINFYSHILDPGAMPHSAQLDGENFDSIEGPSFVFDLFLFI